MLMNIMVFVIGVIIIMTVLGVLIGDYIIAGSIAFFVMLIIHVLIALKRSENRLALIDEKCDPEAFIKVTEKHIKATNMKASVKSFLEVDKALGLISLGQFQEAKDLLTEIDDSVLSEKKGTRLIYTMNMVSALIGLNELEEATELMETEVLTYSTENNFLNRSAKLLKGELAFKLRDYEETKSILTPLLDEAISRREKLMILYTLGRIELIEDNIQVAKEKFAQVYQEGSKLWIGQEAFKLMD